MANFNKILAITLFFSISVFAAPVQKSAGSITSLRFVTGSNGLNYAIISSNSPQQAIAGSGNWVGGIGTYGPNTALQMPTDPTLCALAGGSLERARQNTSVNLWYLDVVVSTSILFLGFPAPPNAQPLSIITGWYLGE